MKRIASHLNAKWIAWDLHIQYMYLFVWLIEQRNVMRKQRNWEKQLAAKKSKRKEEKQRRKLNRARESGAYHVIWLDDTVSYLSLTYLWAICLCYSSK